MVVEHITTADAVAFVNSQNDNVAATITVQHLAFNRNHMLVGGIRPHYFCLPVLKRNTHQQALQGAVVSGSKKFFLGTDSAPHIDALKEHACGCAGCFTATNTLSVLAEVFEKAGALDQLEAFTSLNGPAFYGLPVNDATVTLTKGDAVDYPAKIETGAGPVTVFDPGFPLHWSVA